MANIISGDSHIIEPLNLWFDVLGDRYGDRTPRLLEEHDGQPGPFFFTGPGGQVQRIPKLAEEVENSSDDLLQRVGFDPDARLTFMDRAGVQAEVMNPTFQLALFGMADPEVLRATAQTYNDWVADFISQDPDRLLGVAALPVDDPVWAAQELERVRGLGFRSAIIPLRTPEGAPPYRDPAYDPLWAAAQEAEMPLTLHIVAGGAPHPMHTHQPAEVPGGMIYIYFEVMYPLTNEFVFGGVFDRFPTLQIIHSEYEVAWIPSFMHKLDIIQDTFAHRVPELPILKHKASDYLRTQIFHGMVDDPYAHLVIDAIGAEQVLWGSDFPHAHSLGVDAKGQLDRLLDGVSPANRELLTYTTAAKLFHVG